MLTMFRDINTVGLLITILITTNTIGQIDSAILSRNKNITSVSTYSSDYLTQYAIDGNPRRDPYPCKCCAATGVNLNPWYELDLGKPYIVQRVRVDGRTELQYDQHFQGMQIYLKSIHDGIGFGEETTITEATYNVDYVLPVPKWTRYVSLVLYNVTRVFTICELIVYGECADGEFGVYCEHVCHCDGDPCNTTTGVCPSARCVPGYEGTACDKVCPDGTYGSGCTERCGNCSGNDICDKQDGKCPGQCSSGYQGDMCTRECADGEFGDYCEHVCHCDGDPCNTTTGVCPSGRCLPGYQGEACDKVCLDGTYGSGCTERCGNCSGNAICDKQDGKCPGQCSSGYQGDMCTRECTDGFYGSNCVHECGHCQNGEPCNAVTGTCENGCAAGYQADVTCKTKCTPGTYGVGCFKQCGNCKFGVMCAKANGSCPAGCSGDFTGETCKSVCSAGFYGESCNNECGHCANKEPCDPETGICRNGCSAGYQTTLCNTECNRGRYGLGCSQSCGNCRGGDFCVFTDGTCPNGCEAGYMDDACKTETLEEPSGNDSLLLTISGWVFGGVTVLAAIGIFVVMKIRSRRAQRKPTTNDTSLYDIPRHSRIETDRPYDYPTTNT